MRMRFGMAVLTTAVFAIGAVACDSGDDNKKADTEITADTTSDTTSDTAGPDVTSDADATPDVDAKVDTELPPVDPCDPNPCTNQPAIACNAAGDSTVTYKAEGTCTANGAVAACAYAEDKVTPCAATELCAQGKCIEKVTDIDYKFSPAATYVTALGIAPEGCCFDFDNDGKMDNGLQALLGLLASFLDADVDTLLQESIDDGTITLLLENAGLTDATNQAAGLALNGFFGEAETQVEMNKAGNGTFLASPSSFIEGTQTPLISLAAQIAAGKLTAGPALFQLSIPLGSLLEGSTTSLDLTILNTQVTSDVSLGANGKGLTMANGQLGGVVPVEQFAIALNQLTADCACLGLSGGDTIEVIKTDPKKQKLGCTAAFSASTPTCTEEDSSICSALGDNKSLVCPALGILPFDQDTDEDGQKDAISLGITLTGVSATINGLVPAEPPAAQ